jgi:hypothetical protein
MQNQGFGLSLCVSLYQTDWVAVVSYIVPDSLSLWLSLLALSLSVTPDQILAVVSFRIDVTQCLPWWEDGSVFLTWPSTGVFQSEPAIT